jgi:hypothetical protein
MGWIRPGRAWFAAVVMMARAPWTGGKTRIGVSADEAEHADLRHALFLDTLDAVSSVADVKHIIERRSMRCAGARIAWCLGQLRMAAIT